MGAGMNGKVFPGIDSERLTTCLIETNSEGRQTFWMTRDRLMKHLEGLRRRHGYIDLDTMQVYSGSGKEEEVSFDE